MTHESDSHLEPSRRSTQQVDETSVAGSLAIKPDPASRVLTLTRTAAVERV